jgi:hypothetical protein
VIDAASAGSRAVAAGLRTRIGYLPGRIGHAGG